MTAHLTIITAERPRRLSKAFGLDRAGNLTKQPGGALVRGAAEVRSFDGLAGLAAILKSLTPTQALVYGVPNTDARTIVTREAFEANGRQGDVTPRTNDAFAWAEGAGVLMLHQTPQRTG